MRPPAHREGISDANSSFVRLDLPLDYDHPQGAKTSVAVLRHKATDQKHRIGSLFVNPGGPGGSAVGMAASASSFLGSAVLDRFDIVGVDPRGVAFSDNVHCWKNPGGQSSALGGLDTAFPWTTAQRNAFVTSSRAFGQACSSTGQPLAASMSTAEDARDMDVLRRAVGDEKLTFLGFSYGTYLGNVYANLFPDRVRALAIDGVLDPIAWAGTTKRNRTVPQTALLRSGQASAHALREVLVRCQKEGPEVCEFAGAGDPLQNYAKIIASLKKSPVTIVDRASEEEFTLDYPLMVDFLLSDLYLPYGAEWVASDLLQVLETLQPAARAGSVAADQQSAARAALARKLIDARAAAKRSDASATRRRAAFGFALPYDNSPEAYQALLCTDGVNPPEAAKWPAYADADDKKAPDFGRLWTWASAPCASKTWTARDEDTYRASFRHRTANPVLVVGNYWDPATNYDNAVKVASMLPNSRLLRSNSWGHTAYGTSACATGAVDAYLLTRELPAVGTRCVGDDQPFKVRAAQRRSAAPGTRGLPPGRATSARCRPAAEPVRTRGCARTQSCV
jgi:pimeloyl-ACP methyl ester carboxylesterase